MAVITNIVLLMVALLILVRLFIAKNEVTGDCRITIVKAIGAYRIDHLDEVTLVDYGDMESYNDTLFRFWDWGYTRILPKDKYEIIKPYIEEGKRK